MKAKQLQKLGIPAFLCKQAKWTAQRARQDFGYELDVLRDQLKALAENPGAFREDPVFAELSAAMDLYLQRQVKSQTPWRERDEPAVFYEWGRDLDPKSVEQIANACRLPIATQAALMPDAHLGYGLPIGGVLACENAVIPYAVGVDIACRVKLSVLDLGVGFLNNEKKRDQLKTALEVETRFGMGAQFGPRLGHGHPHQIKTQRRWHSVLDHDWSVSPVTHRLKDKAWAQLGSSGSGNHFVEFGTLTVDQTQAEKLGLDIQQGVCVELSDPKKQKQTDTVFTDPNQPTYVFLALLSHSGSRGTGAAVCERYSQIAQSLHPNLPKPLQHLAWLDLDSHEGQAYWHAMNLMGDYASANHACIHDAMAQHLGAEVLTSIENHHNFAWRETHVIEGESKQLIVHRKGATPAKEGELGVIPGSMAAPGFVVSGLGQPESLCSASHGAGRVMSRRKAAQTYRWAHIRPRLKELGVEVISAGIDENPFVYKDIHEVMADQQDLVRPIAQFDPKLIKMAPDGERAED